MDNGFTNAIDARATEGDLEEEGRGEDVVFDTGDRDVDGIGSEEGDGVDLEEGGQLSNLEVSVESVSNHGIARV